MFIFTVRDSKTEAYLPPFLAHNPMSAKRSLVDAARDPQSMLGMHPEDYQLFQIGVFDEQTGEITTLKHSSMGKIIDFLEPQNDKKE